MRKYYVGTLYKQDDILLVTENGEDFYHLADKRTYSDLGVRPRYHYTRSALKHIRPATEEDFEFFRVQTPKPLQRSYRGPGL